MTVSPEVEELVKRAMRVGDYASENEVLLAALQALHERREAGEVEQRNPNPGLSPFGLRMREIRAQYLAGGGDVLSPEQLDRELALRRGERNLGD